MQSSQAQVRVCHTGGPDHSIKGQGAWDGHAGSSRQDVHSELGSLPLLSKATVSMGPTRLPPTFTLSPPGVDCSSAQLSKFIRVTWRV